MTGLDEGRIARAIVEDVQEGYKEGRNSFTIDKAMIVTNTNLSAHAKRYASCWDIKHIGWDFPEEENIASMVSNRSLCPITILKGVNACTQKGLLDAKIVTVGQLLGESPSEIAKRSGIPENEISQLRDRAKKMET